MSEHNDRNGAWNFRGMFSDFIIASIIATGVIFGSWIGSLISHRPLSWIDAWVASLLSGYACIMPSRGCMRNDQKISESCKMRGSAHRADIKNKLVLSWHLWFAWRPVQLLNGGTAWLRVVERCWFCGRDSLWDDKWIYRERKRNKRGENG